MKKEQNKLYHTILQEIEERNNLLKIMDEFPNLKRKDYYHEIYYSDSSLQQYEGEDLQIEFYERSCEDDSWVYCRPFVERYGIKIHAFLDYHGFFVGDTVYKDEGRGVKPSYSYRKEPFSDRLISLIDEYLAANPFVKYKWTYEEVLEDV